MGMYNFFSLNIFLVLSCLLLFLLVYSSGVSLIGFTLVGSDYLVFDSLSFYLCVLVVFLGVYSVSAFNNSLSSSTKFFLFLSLFFSAVCFCVNHSVLFWCFYELSMLPLLYLIFRDSPYSERFIAGWYFAVYLLITSLPLILVLLYLSFIEGSFFFNTWCGHYASVFIYVVLSFIFFTKVPLSPFHTWLPIVHAEATSIVSIFLSGYIMKLGLLGVYRCAPFLFSGDFFVYLFFCCLFSMFFLITASKELDGKRWLAFLSLSHIVVPFIGFYICGWESLSLTFLFCLGHGLSAGLVFGLLWFFYDSTNTRNWLLLKSGVSGKLPMFILIVGLLSLCSFPPTLQFFCEVNLLTESFGSYIFILFWCVYLFFGGLVPLVLCGHILIRNECIDSSIYTTYNFLYYFFFLSIWCYLGIILL
uniref:NADH-ubiquinone oxidoreductase chain 4 n=2 Tax=unclassified Acanthobothrium TaxID=2666008 RepID=A0A8K1SXZ8_9CEST|nr:NADH dehydrogenase subunit 4 [Acanthobothrium sp. MZUSP 8033]UFQ89014.1 NADH dehydrogenase subunit 4 [Acanthobothrium sp. MZUSP 8034]